MDSVRRAADLDLELTPQPVSPAPTSLANGRRGFVGRISTVGAETAAAGGLAAPELERRLLEMGFVEGARVEIIHEGFIGKDPICVRLDDMRVAVRRRDVRGIMVQAGEP